MKVLRKERLITIDNLKLNYDGKKILDGISLHVDNIDKHGQVVSLLGPSGIGKTQLFRCIAGLQDLTAENASGKITLNGSTRLVQPGEVGVVQQSYPLCKYRTIWSNLKLAAKGSSKSDAEIDVFLEQFDLLDKKKLYPAQLSGGQRQRIAIIQQMLCSEHFILMDEPFSGLDIINKKRVCDLITKVADANELNTFIITTHDERSAIMISDTIWVLGRRKDAAGNIIPGAVVVKEIDLVERDLAWNPNVEKHPNFYPTVLEIIELFHTYG